MMRSPFKSFAVGLVLALVGGIWAIGSYIYVVFEKPIAPNPEGSSILLIPRGTPYSQVKKELQELGLVNQPRLFRYLSLYLNVASRIRAGEFELQHRWNTWQLLQHLTRGKSITHRVTIPEGWNFEEIVERLVNKDLGDREVFLSLFKDSDLLQKTGVQEAPSLEGFLFPETYFFSKIDSERRILQSMIRHYRNAYSREFEMRAEELGMTEYQILILASIIEKETGSSADRPLIASVFHNRLKRRMRLDSDPTVIYGMEDFNGNLTRKDLRTPTAYNTYRRYGLPPTPICSPGVDSIQSALYPANERFLYFVARGDGTSQFSRSLREHNKAVNHYQKNRRVRKMMRQKRLKQNASSTL